MSASNSLNSNLNNLTNALTSLGKVITGAALTGAGASITSGALGAAPGAAVGAAGTLATGAVTAAGSMAGGNPAGAAAAGLTAVAGAAALAAESAKGFAAAASPNGLKGLDQAMQMFQASVGVMLLPFFVKLAAAVATAADFLDQKFTAEAVTGAANTVIDWANQVGEAAKGIAAFTIAVRDAIKGFARWATGKDDRDYTRNKNNDPHLGKKEFGEGGADTGWHPAVGPDGKPMKNDEGQQIDDKGKTKKDATGGDGGWKPIPRIQPGKPGDPKSFDWEGRARQNSIDLLKDMRASLGQQGNKVTTGGITDAWKKAQEAAGGSAFEKNLMEKFEKHLALLEQQVGIARKEEARPQVVVRGR